jgi:hypothetical protein
MLTAKQKEDWVAAQRRIEELEAQLMQMQGREIKLQMALNTPAAQQDLW